MQMNPLHIIVYHVLITPYLSYYVKNALPECENSQLYFKLCYIFCGHAVCPTYILNRIISERYYKYYNLHNIIEYIYKYILKY